VVVTSGYAVAPRVPGHRLYNGLNLSLMDTSIWGVGMVAARTIGHPASCSGLDLGSVECCRSDPSMRGERSVSALPNVFTAGTVDGLGRPWLG
jgi:hypothetical protein